MRAVQTNPLLPGPASDLTLRAQIEEAAEFAVDTAQRLIAILDHMDGDVDLEEGAEAEPSLAAPENAGSQATWTRGGDQDREAEVPEIALPDLPASPIPKVRTAGSRTMTLAWDGSGNVVAAAGVALFDLIERCG